MNNDEILKPIISRYRMLIPTLCQYWSKKGCCAAVEQSNIFCEFCQHVWSNKPVIVPNDYDADVANRTFGESYGVDWEYEGKQEGGKE